MAYTTIDDPSAHFQITIYTGNEIDDTAITNDGNSDLQPDLLWIKERSVIRNHSMVDSSRGVTKHLHSDLDEAEATASNRVKSLDSDGFTVGDSGYTNDDTEAFVAWQWKANGGSRTTNAEDGNNPAGGYQANTTAGFSIVDYTGTGAAGTMAHGLGAVPDVIIIKNRDEADSWAVYHSANTGAPETDYLILDTSAATADDATYWNDTAPTSSVFTVATAHNVNADTEKYMAYCFTSIQGYSKFGSYTGNGDANGTFVFTGFKPRWVLIRRSAANNWHLVDSKRETYNPMDVQLYPNLSNLEYAEYHGMDFLSNGFKPRESSDWINAAELYVYMAFAENPFVTSGGVPCTAR